MSFITNYLYYLAGYTSEFEKTDITVTMTKQEYIQYEKDRSTKYKALSKIKAGDYKLKPLKISGMIANPKKHKRKKERKRSLSDLRPEALKDNIL